jgi:hypothetical protein
VAHLQGSEDAIAHICCIRLARDYLDDEPQRAIVGIGVLEPAPYEPVEVYSAQAADQLLERRVRVAREDHLVLDSRIVGEATGVVEQLAHGDLS